MIPTCFDRVAVPVVMENTEPGKTCGEAEKQLNRNLVAAFIKISVSGPLHLDPEGGLASFQWGQGEQALDLGLVNSVQREVDKAATKHLRDGDHFISSSSLISHHLGPESVPHCGVRRNIEELYPSPIPGSLKDRNYAIGINTGTNCKEETVYFVSYAMPVDWMPTYHRKYCSKH